MHEYKSHKHDYEDTKWVESKEYEDNDIKYREYRALFYEGR